ncbi:MAG: putative 5-formyltetrahydrofolate cyclo-ligase [Elusimicrobia bacterium ADurb.Bin231]|nr:MAG: putative 5-formyltetrahydrofolate cyclo-ligase [Elusimicrobia bacterium ADurb.Bin231]
MLALRRALTPKEVERKSSKICKNFFLLPEVSSAKSVMMYVSFDNEVNTFGIIGELLKKKKKVCVPRISGKSIVAAPLTDLNDLVKGRFGILVPGKVTDRHICHELVVIPGIAFDFNGSRIGFGYGYYDGFLKNFKGFKIGLAYDFQMSENLKQSKYDIAMDSVVTENKIFRRTG